MGTICRIAGEFSIKFHSETYNNHVTFTYNRKPLTPENSDKSRDDIFSESLQKITQFLQY